MGEATLEPKVSQILVSTGRTPGDCTHEKVDKDAHARTMSVQGPQNSQLPSLHSGSKGTNSLGSAKGFLHCGFQNVLASEAQDLLKEVKESIIIPSITTPAILDLSCLSLYGFRRKTPTLKDKGSEHFRATQI